LTLCGIHLTRLFFFLLTKKHCQSNPMNRPQSRLRSFSPTVDLSSVAICLYVTSTKNGSSLRIVQLSSPHLPFAFFFHLDHERHQVRRVSNGKDNTDRPKGSIHAFRLIPSLTLPIDLIQNGQDEQTPSPPSGILTYQGQVVLQDSPQSSRLFDSVMVPIYNLTMDFVPVP
jgi:hypothetical protein